MHDNVSQPDNDELRARYYKHLAQRNQRIIEMRRAGASYRAVARAFDLSYVTVSRIVRNANRANATL